MKKKYNREQTSFNCSVCRDLWGEIDVLKNKIRYSKVKLAAKDQEIEKLGLREKEHEDILHNLQGELRSACKEIDRLNRCYKK